jgi:hypothetical protein
VMVVGGVLGAILLKVLLPPSVESILIIAVLIIVLAYWRASRRAIANHEARRFSIVIRNGLVAANGFLVVFVAALKYRSSIQPEWAGDREPNPSWLATTALRRTGVMPGERIAIIGSPFEAYWARTSRLHIVAVVPPPRMKDYFQLPPARRDALYREFARAGAGRIIVQTTHSPDPGDQSWVPVPLVGWTKRLPGP